MKYTLQIAVLTVFLCLQSLYAFHLPARALSVRKSNGGVKELRAVLDVFAGLSLANQLNSAQLNPSYLSGSSSSMTVAVLETKQGLYKEYTVEKVDDSALDEFKRGYKTAEETDESKNKYWAILAVLIGGSFVIPMVQYYWYVADED
eukprot:gene16457-22443_t